MTMEEILARLDEKKAQLDVARPLPPGIVAKLKEHFDVEWTYHSNAIEGSTLTLAETRLVLLDGLTVGGKSLREHLEAINHKHAIDFVEALAAKVEPVTEHNIRQIHALILRTIDDENAGAYRRAQVYITGSTYVPPAGIQVPSLMQELVTWINSAEAAGLHPVERGARAHFRLVHVHPFVDGNGRTARLLMNLILVREGYPPAVIRHERRPEYYDTLDRAHEGDTNPFLALVAEEVERSLDIWLDMAGSNKAM
ncbi:MAG: Fic family protein [Anaerolineae bacterium]